MPAPVIKYRPYFTLDQLYRIHAAFLNRDSPLDKEITIYLTEFIKGIEFKVRKGSHRTVGHMTITEELGLVDEMQDKYRYENDLMSDAEEREYEKRMGVG